MGYKFLRVKSYRIGIDPTKIEEPHYSHGVVNTTLTGINIIPAQTMHYYFRQISPKTIPATCLYQV